MAYFILNEKTYGKTPSNSKSEGVFLRIPVMIIRKRKEAEKRAETVLEKYAKTIPVRFNNVVE